MSAISYRLFGYESRTKGESWCDLAVIRAGEGATVILRERKDNPGMSVTNFAEGLATKIWQELLSDLDPSDITWYETYDDQVFDQITFGVVPAGQGGFFGMPQWERVASSVDQPRDT